ncbi:MAG: dipicolinate synthase [Lachnospiraceae bacterium]|nr:dipicolinate synthase [Lachnospiraceae bacterium]
MNPYNITLLGGDRRIACMAPVLIQKGCRLTGFSVFECPLIPPSPSLKKALENAGTVICGIPFSRGETLLSTSGPPVLLSELKRHLRKKQLLFGGLIPENFRRHCEERQIECFDFLKDPSLTLMNAAATAEGAVSEALLGRDTLLCGHSCLVLGYGRCGSLIADRLYGLRGEVTVCSADPIELSDAMSHGLQTFSLADLSREISRFDYIFNTIPVCCLTEDILKQVRPKCLIIDIASDRKGADYEAAKNLSVNLRYCPGLPGKYAAVSCAQQMAQFVLLNINSKKKGAHQYESEK